MRLETLHAGDELTVWVDDPKGARDIPRAAEAEGYAVDDVVVEAGALWRLRIQV